MNNRGGLFPWILMILLAVVLVLQIVGMRRSADLTDGMGRLAEAMQGAATRAAEPVVAEEAVKSYPGDEGDWLIWGYRVEPATLNQISVDNDIYSRWITIPAVFEPLLDYDPETLELKPYLAESVEVSEDGLEITFTLREEAHFSDGEPVTSEDVVFTFETIMNPEVDASNIAQMFYEVDRVEALGERQVRFYMKNPFFKALDNLSFVDTGIYPKHIYEFDDPMEFNQRVSEPVGSGPYVFEKWDVGREIVLRRNENYWGRKPNFRKVIYRFITNSIAALQALRSGQIDAVIPEPEQFSDLAEDAEFQEDFHYLSYYEPRVPFFYIGWNMDTPYFADARVRLAMTHIVDRQRIVEQLLKGSGRITTGPFYTEGQQHDATIEPWPYDPERARELLTEAGWIDTDGDGIRDKGGREFSFKFLYSSGNTLYDRLVKLLKDETARVGIELQPDPYEWSVLLPKLSDGDFEAMVMGWGGDMVQDPYQIWHSSQAENRGSNYVGYRDARADELIEQARRTIDPQKRNAMYHELHRMLHEEQPYTFLFERPMMRLIDKRFRNVVVHPKGLEWMEWYVPRADQKYQ